MAIRGLKTHIAINIAAILLISTILINLVMNFMTQRHLKDYALQKGKIILSYLEAKVSEHGLSKSSMNINGGNQFQSDFTTADEDVLCAQVIDQPGNIVFEEAINCPHHEKLKSQLITTITNGREIKTYEGSGWGVLWKQRQFAIISRPIYVENKPSGAAGIIVSFESLYQTLRLSQKTLFFYIIINTILLTFICSVRLFNAYVKPMQRLVRRAEEYEAEDEGFLFSVRKQDNELGKLSIALNQMTRRISEDKIKLRSTVAELEKVNEELKKAQGDIIRAEKLASVGRLSSGIAHEIGNPISIVLGYLDLLKTKDLSLEAKKLYLDRAENEIVRINKIIQQLLDLSRPIKSEPKQVHIHRLLDDVVNVVRFQPSMSRLDFRYRFGIQNDSIRSDPDLLRQIVLNLIINSADAIMSDNRRDNGIIRIYTMRSDGSEAGFSPNSNMLKIVINDNGPGIPKQYLGDVFDPFFTTKEPGKGTGLGLSVSYMIVEQLGGIITASSEEGEGTTMSIYLPVG